MKQSSLLGIVAILFLILISVRVGAVLFCSTEEWSHLLIKGGVLVFITISLLCFLYSTFCGVKELELEEIKIKEKKSEWENKKEWEKFVFELNNNVKALDNLKSITEAKEKAERELSNWKTENEEVIQARDKQIKQMYTYMLLAQGKGLSKKDIEKIFDETEKSFEEITKHLK